MFDAENKCNRKVSCNLVFFSPLSQLCMCYTVHYNDKFIALRTSFKDLTGCSDSLLFPLSHHFSLCSGQFKLSAIAAKAVEMQKSIKMIANVSATSYTNWQRRIFPLVNYF